MAKVFIHATLSLDGFMARPDDDVSWGFKYGADEMGDEVVKEIGGLTFTFVGGIERAISQARQAAGDKSVALLRASIDQQALKAGLVDKILIHLAPVLNGEGIRLFDHLGAADIELERTEIAATSQITSLRFRVVQSARPS